jgi:hypothetical protein
MQTTRHMYLHKPIVLCKNISALAIARDEHALQYGHIEQLPTGATVVLIGDGFNGRTVKVQWNGQYYFVFLQDIEGPDPTYYLD